MKKLFALLLTVCATFVCLVACQIPTDISSNDSSIEISSSDEPESSPFEESSMDSSCEHTYEWIFDENKHQKVYTCGCFSPDAAEAHIDSDENAYCDICEYYVGINDLEDGFYVGAYPQEFVYQNRRYCNLDTGSVSSAEVGELIGYIIREEDVSAFTNEYPGVDYVIDAGIYDYYNKNRVPFFAVEGYEDLSVIYLYESGAYELFQDVTNFLSGDFSFSLTWNVDGISSYDSITGKLVKTKDTSEPELYTTTHYLTEDEKTQILDILLGLDVLFYPNIYNPAEGVGSNPSQDLILSVQSGNIVKTITAKDVAITTDVANERGQKYLDACEAISEILMGTEEWKSLPDYPYLYD